MNKITMLGAGAFGFAMTKVIAENNPNRQIFLFDVQEEVINNIKQTQEHPFFYKGVKIPSNVTPTFNIKEAVDHADLIVLSIPSKFLRNAIHDFKIHLPEDPIFLNLAKGLENETNKTISQIMEEELKGKDYQICSLSGGMIAQEVINENPLCANIACKNTETAEKVAKLIRNNYLRIETTDDLIGVELSGAFKNVIAIGAGIFDGLGYSESSKSAFVSDTAKEMSRLALVLGAKKETFEAGGHAWFGDLMTTCFGKSRNRELGELIGKGTAVNEAVQTIVKNKKSIEGYITAKVVHELINQHKITAPILNSLYEVLYGDKKPQGIVRKFISH